MKTLHFQTDINAPKESVWHALWDDANYRSWTSAFSEGSYALSDWKQGSKIQFLSAEGDGMYSEIAELRENKFMSFRHLGIVKDGLELPSDEESKKWAGAMENYSLDENEGITTLKVEVDITDDHFDYFNKVFPLALARVKELAEKGQ